MENSSGDKACKRSRGYKVPDSGIFRLIPASCIPYAELMRLDRPAGFYAFYWHYAIGFAFAACIARPPISPIMLGTVAAYLALWVVIFRGAVCAWNDNIDQEFDRQTSRTWFRPIARGAVSTAQGHIFMAALIVPGAVMLAPLPQAVGTYAAVMSLVLAIYPFGKRFTDFPQVILGFGFAIPIFLCCAAVGTDPLLQPELYGGPDPSRVAWGAACLYGASTLWTIILDTIYAHQDLKDDIKTGVKSLAVYLGDSTKLGLGFLGSIQIALIVTTGRLCQFSALYFILSCGATGLALVMMLVLVDLQNPRSCAWWFGPGSRLVGTSIVAGLVGHYIVSFE